MTKNRPIHEELPALPESYWRDTCSLPVFPKLEEPSVQADVAIVGGGITGMTTAYLLASEGYRTVLLEAGRLFNGTTGHTTAKITAQHDLIYHELIGMFGEEKAKLYYQANAEAAQFIQRLVEKHRIACGFCEQDAYIYTETEESVRRIADEMTAYHKLGIPGEWVDACPLPVPIKGAIVMKGQAQFHPLQYVKALTEQYLQAGGVIYENTMAHTVEEGTAPTIITKEGCRVTAKHVISCTHFPFFDGKGYYFTRLHAERSYVLGIPVGDEADLEGMYLSADHPKRSVRTASAQDGEWLLLIGGESHKTGQGICTMRHYEALRAFAERMVQVPRIAYRWSAQDLVTLDKVPYIGPVSSGIDNVLVATGFRKWGMTNSTGAGLLLRDIVQGKDSPYRELYTPSRFQVTPDVKNFVVHNADVAKHLVGGKLESVQRMPEDLAVGEGAVVTIDGRRAGAFRDEHGTLHIVDTTCTHMGCELEWNSGERSWDCPCHGSRFSMNGKVLEGPAKKPLTRLDKEA